MDLDLDFMKKQNLRSEAFQDDAHVVKNINVRFAKVKNLNTLIGGLPANGEDIRIITRNRFDTFDFIILVLKHVQAIDDMYIAIYRIGKKTLTSLVLLFDKNIIKKLHVVINDGFEKLMPEVCNMLYNFAVSRDNFDVHLINTHAKVICMRADENYFVVEGSGNMNINARIEQYSFANSKTIFIFHSNWMKNVATKSYASL